MLFHYVCAEEVDVDNAIVAADPLCQQALYCQAEDMAIEDTLYALERALTDGHLPADTYLKQVCTGSSRQDWHCGYWV